MYKYVVEFIYHDTSNKRFRKHRLKKNSMDEAVAEVSKAFTLTNVKSVRIREVGETNE